jgi:hypothetical protein
MRNTTQNYLLYLQPAIIYRAHIYYYCDIMFESEDDLNFRRKEGSVSKTVEITLEAAQ